MDHIQKGVISMTRRLVTLEERQKHKKIDEYIRKVNIALIILLTLFCLIILIGWIFG